MDVVVKISSSLPDIKQAVSKGQILWRKHALERMMERGITRKQVKQAIQMGKIIESYPTDHPIPSFLICTLKPSPIHIVLSFDDEQKLLHIITVYLPDLFHFRNDYITRL